jgi:hypothetical protein
LGDSTNIFNELVSGKHAFSKVRKECFFFGDVHYHILFL